MKTPSILSTLALFTFCCASSFAADSLVRDVAVAKSQNVEYTDSLSLLLENDMYFSDRYYTNGIKLLYTTEGDDFLASRLQFMVLRLFGLENRQASQTVCLGQDMFVSSNINDPNPPTWDRPYAGWLYIGAGAHLAAENRLDSLSVNLGVVGPISLAEDAQKFIHSITSSDWPMGWDTQIKNEPGIVIAYNHAERVFKKNLSGNFSTDAVLNIGADLGNVMTQGKVGALFRFGFNLPDNFAPMRIESHSAADVYWRNPNARANNWHCYMYGGGIARFVGYDISLNGNTFADSRSVTPKWLVGEAVAGISSRYDRYQVDLAWTLRTTEFNTQYYPVHMFWTLKATIHF